MKYHISIHISPYEIDNYQLFIHQLRRNLNYVSNEEIIFNPCLNLSNYFYDWDGSILKSEFFINKFNELNKIVENQVTLDSIINFDNKILGALSYKREFINKYKNQVDAFIWFDSDMIFPDDLLFYLINSFESINQKYCIITPQITKLWDNTWDVIVNENYINQVPSNYIYTNFDGYNLYNTQTEEKKLVENLTYTKFASGWCNLLSSNLFKTYINFAEDLGHYGIDDTFIMYTVDLYKQKGHDIKQFIINNLVVIENNKFKISSYDNLIIKNSNIRNKENFRIESEQGMIMELNKINNKINV
jgi:hypothetical protein